MDQGLSGLHLDHSRGLNSWKAHHKWLGSCSKRKWKGIMKFENFSKLDFCFKLRFNGVIPCHVGGFNGMIIYHIDLSSYSSINIQHFKLKGDEKNIAKKASKNSQEKILKVIKFITAFPSVISPNQWSNHIPEVPMSWTRPITKPFHVQNSHIRSYRFGKVLIPQTL